MSKSIKQEKPIYRYPGCQQFLSFITKHPKLFNLSEMERLCDFTPATLRHMTNGTRELKREEYRKLQEVILPKLTEAVFLLQNYTED